MKQDEETALLEKSFRECLSGFSGFSEKDEIFAFKIERNNALGFGYNTNNRAAIIRTNLQVEGEKCYILDIEVREDKFRHGFGRSLFDCIERFALRLGCKDLETTPSGMGKLFWPKMGFIPDGPISAIKKLKRPFINYQYTEKYEKVFVEIIERPSKECENYTVLVPGLLGGSFKCQAGVHQLFFE